MKSGRHRCHFLSLMVWVLAAAFLLSGCTKSEKAVSTGAEEASAKESDTTQDLFAANDAESVKEESLTAETTEAVSEEPAPADVIEWNGKYYSALITSIKADVNADTLESVLQFPNLTKLDISEYPKDAAEIRAILEKAKEQRPEMVIRYALSLAKAGAEDISVSSSSEELILNDIEITDLAALKECLDMLPSLQQLEMCDCGVKDEDMAKIREEYPQVKVVWMLHMGRHSLRTDAVAFSTLSYDGEPDRLTSEDAEVLRYCTDLMALDLGHQSLTDVSFLDALPELRVLILADNNITDLAPIGRLSELRYLELFINYHITSWDELANLTKLEDLNICFNDWAKDFSFLEGLPNLQRFWAIGCVFTAAQDAQIRSLIPEDCVYRWGGSTESTGAGWRESEKFEAEYEMFRTNTLHPMFE